MFELTWTFSHKQHNIDLWLIPVQQINCLQIQSLCSYLEGKIVSLLVPPAVCSFHKECVFVGDNSGGELSPGSA